MVSKRRLNKAIKIVEQWREDLLLDPIWEINVVECDDEEMVTGGIAQVDISGAEYYRVVIGVHEGIFKLQDDHFESMMHLVIAHELSHLISVDYHRTAMLAAGKNENMKGELVYRYEQFTSRLEKIFLSMKGLSLNPSVDVMGKED